MKKIILLILFIFSFLKADISEYFPKLDGRVIDQVNLLTSDVKNDINSLLKEHERKTSNQIVVVILNSLNDYSIEDYSYQLGRYWGIGEKEKNNGVLLVISMEEKKIRIEVGYGLEGKLTDKISSEIIEYTIKPNFKASQYELGILKAVNEIIATIKGEYISKSKNKDYNKNNMEVLLWGITFLSIFINIIAQSIRNKFLYKSSISFILAFMITFFMQGIFITSAIIIVFLIIFAIIYITSKADFDEMPINKFQKALNDKGFDFNSFDSKDFFAKSEGFSGRGGNFGGGGASGGW